MTLSREILKWIQSLDLSYSVKNIRRDFSNGFLVAEMISRYHPKEIQMHSYDTAINVKAKKDNWKLLEKYFKQKRVAISREMIDNVIKNKPDASEEVLETLFSYLTKREIIKKPPAHPPTVELPSFARPTELQKIKDDGRSNYTTSLQHNTSVGRKVRKLDRSQLDSQQSVQFKEVQIKTLDKFQTRSKIQKKLEQQSQQNSFRSNHSLQGSRSISHSMADGTEGQMGFMTKQSLPLFDKSVHDQLNSIVESCLHDSKALKIFDEQKKDYISSFVQSVDALDEQDADKVFREIKTFLSSAVDTIIHYPKEFWKLAVVFVPGLKIPETSPNFNEFLDIFHELGSQLVKKDQQTAWELFEDFALDKIITMIKQDVTKRRQLLSILYAFCPSEPKFHWNVIKTLQEKINNNEIYISCLSDLVDLEEQLSDDLARSYVFYSVLGLSSGRPRLRASSVSMLSVIAEYNPSYVFEVFDDKLLPLLKDDWWETRLQLLLVSSKLLQKISHDSEFESNISALYNVITEVIGKDANALMYKVALSALTPLLQSHPPLLHLYIDILLEISERDRVDLLSQGPRQVETFQIGTGYIYEVHPIAYHWHGIGIAETLLENVQDEERTTFELAHYDILDACIQTAPDQDDDLSRWINVLQSSLPYLLAGSLDDEYCDNANDIIFQMAKYLHDESPEDIFHSLNKIVDLVYKPQTSPSCKESMTGLLIRLYDLDGIYTKQLTRIGKRLMQANPEVDSILTPFILHVSREETIHTGSIDSRSILELVSNLAMSLLQSEIHLALKLSNRLDSLKN